MFAKVINSLSFNKINIGRCFQWERDVAKKHCWLFMFMYCFCQVDFTSEPLNCFPVTNCILSVKQKLL